jgi:hypothetical protein
MAFVQERKKLKLTWYSLHYAVAAQKMVYWTRKASFCTAGLYLASPCVGSCEVKLCAYCPRHCKLSQLAAFRGDGPEWRRFHCSHIWEQMMDNVHKLLSFTFLQVSFLWSTHPMSCLSCADRYYLFRSINHNIISVYSSHFPGYIRVSCEQMVSFKGICCDLKNATETKISDNMNIPLGKKLCI